MKGLSETHIGPLRPETTPRLRKKVSGSGML